MKKGAKGAGGNSGWKAKLGKEIHKFISILLKGLLKMDVIIRQERETDYELTEAVVEKAFKNAEYSDHREHFLIARLRKSSAFLPELSLVAELVGEKIVGHIMFSLLTIETDDEQIPVLGLAPVAVLPEHQNRGIGSALIEHGLKECKKLGFKIVVLVGHPNYYPRFGFVPAGSKGLKAPFEVPDEAFMVLELSPGALANIKGTVKHPPEFGI